MLHSRSRTVAVALALSAVLPLSASAANGERDRALLDRYRPMLRYDSREEYRAQVVSLPPGTAEVRDREAAYGRVATEGDERWLQYWFFYAENPQDRSPLRTGRHGGDWELVQMRLGKHGRPDRVVLSQHSWAESCTWHDIDRHGDTPIVYVANASHANYSRLGAHDRPFPDPTDEADGEGERSRPPVRRVSGDSPAWIRFAGTWGSTDAGVVPGEMSSPRGPRYQVAWNHPSGYVAGVGRSCGSGAPGRAWQTAALGIVVGLVIAGLLLAAAVARRRATCDPPAP